MDPATSASHVRLHSSRITARLRAAALNFPEGTAEKISRRKEMKGHGDEKHEVMIERRTPVA
jgi:hypothetical protein